MKLKLITQVFCLLILILCLIHWACASSRGSLYQREEDSFTAPLPVNPPRTEISPKPLPNPTPISTRPRLYLETNIPGAEVYLNNIYYGVTPLTSTSLAYGTYYLTLIKENCRIYHGWITYDPFHQDFYFELELITGTLELEFSPPMAQAIISGNSLKPGSHELPVGNYTLTISLFGYETFYRQIQIEEGVTTRIAVELKPATFTINNLTANRLIFNPHIPSPAASISLFFEVTAPGTGYIIIHDQNEKEISRFGPFTFNKRLQRFDWDGRDALGKAFLTDGLYCITVEGTGKEGTTTSSSSLELRIDSGYNLKHQSLWCGGSGLWYVPIPEVLPEQTQELQATALLFIEKGGNLFSPVSLGLRLHLAKAQELDFCLSSILTNSHLPSLSLSLAYSFVVKAAQESLDFGFGFVAKLSYQYNYRADLFSRPTGLSVGLPFSLNLGPISLVFCPEIITSYVPVSYGASPELPFNFYMWLYGRFGIYCEESIFRLGLSANLRSLPLNEGLGLSLPWQTALEATVYIPGSPLYLTLVALLEFEDLSSYWILGGLSFGLLW